MQIRYTKARVAECWASAASLLSPSSFRRHGERRTKMIKFYVNKVRSATTTEELFDDTFSSTKLETASEVSFSEEHEGEV